MLITSHAVTGKRLPMVSRRFEIMNKGMRIVGLLELSTSGPMPAIVLMHGYSGDKDEHGRFQHASQRLQDMGFAVIRFDFRYGKTPENGSESDGQLIDMTPAEWISDAKAITAYAVGLPEIDRGRMGVIGLSMGGYTAICAAARDELLRAVVAWSAPAKLRPTRRWIRGREHLLRFRSATHRFVPLRDCKRIAPRPFLAVAGTADDVVNYRNAVDLFQAAREPKSLYILGGADHVFSAHQDELLNITLNWLHDKLKA
jgi:dipeptidyl aminopeptidase/acylaminoacyl peptidase